MAQIGAPLVKPDLEVIVHEFLEGRNQRLDVLRNNAVRRSASTEEVPTIEFG